MAQSPEGFDYQSIHEQAFSSQERTILQVKSLEQLKIELEDIDVKYRRRCDTLAVFVGGLGLVGTGVLTFVQEDLPKAGVSFLVYLAAESSSRLVWKRGIRAHQKKREEIRELYGIKRRI